MTVQSDFQVRFREWTDRFRAERAALFFRGFSPAQNRALLSCPESGGWGEKLLGPGGALDIPALEAQKGELARSLSRPAEGPFVGIYEQLTAALSAEPGFAALRGGRVVVVENNLFSRRCPAAVPAPAARELCAYFRGESADAQPELRPYLNYYGEAVSPDDRHYFAACLDRDTDEKFESVPFYEEKREGFAEDLPGAKAVPVSGRGFAVLRAELAEGRLPQPAVYTAVSEAELARSGFFAFASLLGRLGVPYAVRLGGSFNDTRGARADEFLPLLRRYWGKDASFREMEFYRDPDSSRATERISQGLIISQIARQCALALGGSGEYRNVFITAPTGSGKSLLFQLPALHLALTRGAVTLVVTPLIALMEDQVSQLEREHGISCATFLNSSITFEERRSRVAQIKSGEKSIVYLAPELLVSAPLESIIGGRDVGLFVVDEAHIVTSWGKDFRADYWYLGDFLADLHKSGRRFPVLCLTATAVYGGPEDVVNETIESLSLGSPILYLGSVRRPDIEFDIRRADPAAVSGGAGRFKVRQTARAVSGFVREGGKALVYCPFVSQVEEVYSGLDPQVRPAVRKYYGTMDRAARDAAQQSFRQGECRVMICTKAFGMGVDVRDIQSVYHFAPTGGLADYVQEIGRAARGEGVKGRAITDFLPGDIRYARILYELSEMKQYQLSEMLRKLDSLFRQSGRRGLTVSPGTFVYLFGERELENKVKNGLLLIAKDLGKTYGFPVLNVRPKAVSVRSFVNVPAAAERAFRGLYGPYARLLDDSARRLLLARGGLGTSDTAVVNSGKIYELDMAKVWAEGFRDISFLQFRHLFFSGGLFRCENGERLSPRLRVRVAYRPDFPRAMERFRACLTALSALFRGYRSSGTGFTAAEFKKALASVPGAEKVRPDFAGTLLELFVADVSHNVAFRTNRDRLRFVSPHRPASGGDTVYRVMNSGYLSMQGYLLRLAEQCAPAEDGVYQAFIPTGKNGTPPERLRLLSLLELLGLAACEVEGGRSTEIFVRVNDPQKLAYLARAGYKNGLLAEIRRRHRSAQELMLEFLSGDFTSEERWDMIEEYFLGRRLPAGSGEDVTGGA